MAKQQHQGSDARAKLREAVLAAAAAPPETIDLGGGLVVELRRPTVKGRAAILRAAGVTDKDQVPDLDKLQAEAVLQCCFVPGTGERVFGREDLEAMVELPAGGPFDQLAEKAVALINVDVEAAKKNSAPTPSDSPSSPSPRSSGDPSAS